MGTQLFGRWQTGPDACTMACMKPKIDWWEVLDFFCWGLETLGRPSISRALRGFDEDRYRALGPNFWQKLESEQWLLRRGRGANAQFTITEKGKQQCAEANPHLNWDDPWDGRWRLVTFDVPEVRSKDRVALWRELRARRFGLLQRSVWIWPRPMEAILGEIIHARGIPECFVGFECSRVFLCTHKELVKTAWDFASIRRDHEGYLKRANSLLGALAKAPNLTALAAAARIERLAYEKAIEHDPLLPRILWPAGYLGPKVWEWHSEARVALRHQFTRVLPKGK